MNFKSIIGVLLLVLFFAGACNNNDDGGIVSVPLRDQAEQFATDNDSIVAFLQTHFYELDAAGEIVFDTIAGDNAARMPIYDDASLITEVIEVEGVNMNLYVLPVIDKPVPEAGIPVRITDSVFMTLKGNLLDNFQFESILTPVWFDLANPNLARGFSVAQTSFDSGDGTFTINPDGTISFDNFAQGAVFMPSGLAFFERPVGDIPFYSPLIFRFKIFKRQETDHDRDGVPSNVENLNSNKNPFDDDTDGDGTPNFSDADDDNDGTLTRDEIIINEDGSISFPDSDGDGTPDYLDNRNDS